MGGAVVCGAKHAEDEEANVPVRELHDNGQRRHAGRPPLGPGALVGGRPPAINTNNPPVIRLSTPHEKRRVASIDYTPVGEEKNIFPYHCPLCFSYFAETIFETSCCKNYVCEGCILDFLKGKEGLPTELNAVPKKLPLSISCPHCGTAAVNFAYVAAGAVVRSYSTSPSTMAALEHNSISKLTPREQSIEQCPESTSPSMSSPSVVKEASLPRDGFSGSITFDELPGMGPLLEQCTPRIIPQKSPRSKRPNRVMEEPATVHNVNAQGSPLQANNDADVIAAVIEYVVEQIGHRETALAY